MKFTFLGTGAANAYPEAFCRCAQCLEARSLGGPSLRKRSSALVNHDLLIDLGPDIHSAAQQHALDLSGVRYCLQTHAHADHLDASHLLSRSPAYGVTGAPLLHFYISPRSLDVLDGLLARDTAPARFSQPQAAARLNVAVHPVERGQTFAVGPYRVTALPANHDPFVDPLLYVIEHGPQALFYALDTAALPEETWQDFHQLQLRFDLVVFDHTYGPLLHGEDHLNAAEVAGGAARMRAEGLLKPSGRVFASHIAHDANPVHPALAAYAAQYGYEAAYDGLVVDLDLWR